MPALRKGWESAGFAAGDADSHRSWVQWVNLLPAYDGTPMILAINGGKYARHLDSVSQEGVMREGMKALRDMFGSGIPEPTDFRASNWTYYPHVLGAYPYWKASGRQQAERSKRGGQGGPQGPSALSVAHT